MVFELNPGFNPTTLLLSGMLTYYLRIENTSRKGNFICFEKSLIVFFSQMQTENITLEYTLANKGIIIERKVFNYVEACGSLK